LNFPYIYAFVYGLSIHGAVPAFIDIGFVLQRLEEIACLWINTESKIKKVLKKGGKNVGRVEI
jgi:hypothetical protein